VLQSILELEHHFAFLILILLKITMLEIAAGTKSGLNRSSAGYNATLLNESLMFGTKLVLHGVQTLLEIQDIAAGMAHGDPVCNSGTNEH
jgi:hypothetical protein